jgi:hypothetical protein
MPARCSHLLTPPLPLPHTLDTNKSHGQYEKYPVSRLSCGSVLDEPYSKLIPLSGVAVQARQSTVQRLEQCSSYVAWRAAMTTPLSGLGFLSKVRLKLLLLVGAGRRGKGLCMIDKGGVLSSDEM